MVYTMFFNIFYPIIEFLIFWLLRHLYRMLDQCRIITSNFKRTRVKTLPAFVELYSGPKFFFHYKHSFILNAIFVTMLFGPGIPILFPITLITLIVLYAVEWLMLAYSYQRPPMYDETINKNTIEMISASPILYALSASWIFSN